MKEISVSVRDLYDAKAKFPYIPSAFIEVEDTYDNPYYDLKDNMYGTLCMDGETCGILNETGEYVELLNTSGFEPVSFKLSKEEYQIAAF